MIKKSLISFYTLFLVLYCFISCSLNIDNVIKYGKKVVPNDNNRLWTVLIYMAADNDLEYAAIEDLYEMECSKLNTEKVSVFVLLDRSKSYDASNENWTGTRLYQLRTGRTSDSEKIISKEIDCTELGLKKGNDTDLDMASEYVLSNAISYIYKEFPAEHLGFIMWGHGTGWRSVSNNAENENKYKGFAHDDTSDNYMTLKQFASALGKGLNRKCLDFIGLDTCFSGELEVMYELQNLTKYAVGTEGLLLMSGWNYKNIFDDFEKDKMKTPITLTKNIINNFSKEYSMSSGASVVGINMEYISEYFKAFDQVMGQVAMNINTRHTCDDISSILLSQNNYKTVSYSYGKEDSDLYLDINSIFCNFSKYFSNNENIISKIDDFMKIKSKCVIENWASNNGEGGLGVYYGTLTAGNLLSTVHPSHYIKNKTEHQIKFVVDSTGYVSSIDNNNNFLGKLFYTSFSK